MKVHGCLNQPPHPQVTSSLHDTCFYLRTIWMREMGTVEEKVSDIGQMTKIESNTTVYFEIQGVCEASGKRASVYFTWSRLEFYSVPLKALFYKIEIFVVCYLIEYILFHLVLKIINFILFSVLQVNTYYFCLTVIFHIHMYIFFFTIPLVPRTNRL